MNKRLLILLGAVAFITTFFVLCSNFNDSEKTLAESMEKSKKEHQKIEELMTKASQEFRDIGYGEASLSFFSFEERILRVQVKDEKFIDNHGNGMKSLIRDLSKEIKLENVEVKFEVQVEVNEEEIKLTEQLTEIIKTTSELLNEKNYQFSSVGIYPTTSNPIIEIRIEGTKEYFNAVKDEVSLLVADAVSSKTNINFNVKVNRRSENEIRDEKWLPIFTTIREETDKKFEEYNGFAYYFHPEPLQIIIKTDISKSKWWWNSDKKVKKIEKYVHEIIKLKREELLIEEIPYEIIIRDIENKKLN